MTEKRFADKHFGRLLWSTKTKMVNQIIGLRRCRQNVTSAKRQVGQKLSRPNVFRSKDARPSKNVRLRRFNGQRKNLKQKIQFFIFVSQLSLKSIFGQSQSQSLKDLGRKFGLIRQQILRKICQKLCVSYS